jgi:putative flippase GtrA
LTGIVEQVLELPLVRRVVGHRFIKFGTVGLLGTIINLTVLYLNQEYLFNDISPAQRRLYFSLSGAIFVATLSNYLWNRLWTWTDRKGKTMHGFFIQMGQYFLASGLAICIQYVLTILISWFIHYLIANILAIVIAAIFTYLLNDVWTFALRKSIR